MGLIEVEDLTVEQGRFRLHVPRLVLNTGEMVAVCGNNGSGKSTFLAALAGLKPYRGRYRLNGRDFSALSRRERARLVSFLPQGSTVSLPFEVSYLVLTGRFPLVKGSRYRDEDRAAVEEALTAFDLAHLKERTFLELSGGEKQRVLLARTFVRKSPVFLLDEPFTAIDLRHQHRFLRLFRETARSHLLVAVMHDLALAIEHFARFLFFREGRLLYDLRREDLNDQLLSEVFGCRIRLLRCEGHYLVEVEGEER